MGEESGTVRVAEFLRDRRALISSTRFKSEVSWADIVKQVKGADSSSGQPYDVGEVQWPFNFEAAKELDSINSYHSACLRAKVQSTVGLGLKGTKRKLTPKEAEEIALGMTSEEDIDSREEPNPIEDKLNPLCDVCFQDVLVDATFGFVEMGTGYIEVVRAGKEVAGIHHLPTQWIKPVRESRWDYHYEIQAPGQLDSSIGSLKFARFGDLEGMRERLGLTDDQARSEVIALRQTPSKVKLYGWPDWMSATPPMELAYMHRQHNYDFFQNRGVPEFMAFFVGPTMKDDDFKKIQDALKAGIGLGNSYKSLAVHIKAPADEMKIQLEKLGLDSGSSTEGQFSEVSETLAIEIVSAHRVPPILAGILIPGKLGASNEIVNALQAFQVLVIQPFQKTISETLKNTLGMDPSLGIDPKLFKFRTILDTFDLKKTDTVARMRQPLAQAQAQGRNMDAGVKK